MKLFQVRIKVDVVVAAENVKQAEEIISEDRVEWRHKIGDADIIGMGVTHLDQLNKEWQDALPYGLGPNSKTCREVLEEEMSEDMNRDREIIACIEARLDGSCNCLTKPEPKGTMRDCPICMVFLKEEVRAIPPAEFLARMNEITKDAKSGKQTPGYNLQESMNNLSLCVFCLEKRLNRPLTINDLASVPVNDPVLFGYSLASARSSHSGEGFVQGTLLEFLREDLVDVGCRLSMSDGSTVFVWYDGLPNSVAALDGASFVEILSDVDWDAARSSF